jgi:hypothetical protein
VSLPRRGLSSSTLIPMRRRLHHPDVVPRTPNEDQANRYTALQKKIPPPRHWGLARWRHRRQRWEEGGAGLGLGGYGRRHETIVLGIYLVKMLL